MGVLRLDMVQLTNDLPMTWWFKISSAATASLTLHALRVLRGHGMDDAALQSVFRVDVVSKLQYVICKLQ